MSSSARVSVRPVRVAAPPRPPLTRDRECLVSGVSAGLARHLGARVWMVRALFIGLALCGGAGILLYTWCWMFTSWEDGDASPTRRMPVAWLLLVPAVVGTLLVLFWRGGTDWLSGTIPSDAAAVVVGGTVAFATGAGLWATLIDSTDTARGPRHTMTVRVLATALLGLMFALLLARPGASVGVALVLVPLAGLLAVILSTMIPRWRDLAGERVRRIREEQRSEMAAHLHDSVLQTLALIQNRAGASSEAARLARAQERELRAWLYDGDAPADSDLATDLRDYAGGLELDYPVRIDVVSAGLSAERASGELAAAAREAMLNAARHAGGEISVYIEGSATGVDVFVRDRGAGFRLDDVPGDRLGVRESIVGRMRRAGGSGTVRSEANGTEVHLHITTSTFQERESRG
ncbi:MULTISPECIES: ATP-binding protein [unclassified Microbacterium]|uniref:ATP-binding protein n=1 Tax=unclassified Microbacterium TaxID=2609290 RepID=UPI000EAA8508|nr:MULTISPECIES: ATP-binding protein [unclassified Microbacterium]MBT2483416.1 PspC domain-containing protein [Microbacterium sp. ISL-108]RKN66445.1 ATP-binding protein [Microbacterium sp. CGR2]